MIGTPPTSRLTVTGERLFNNPFPLSALRYRSAARTLRVDATLC